jgi:hypothetical protein
VQGQSIRNGAVEVEYTSKALSGWGGLTLFFEFADRTGFFEALEHVLPSKKTSPNQIARVDIVKTIFAAVLIGGSRFAHVDRVRGDEVMRTILGAERVGGSDTTRRYFDDLTRSECEEVYSQLQRFLSRMLWDRRGEDVLDLDSTILERYGRQEGVSKGYHSARAGQLSHHPLLGMLAGSKHIVHVWLRAGGASTMRGAKEFVDELVARLPEDFKITAVRADSGFHTEEFLRALEAKKISYLVAVRMHPPIKRLAAGTPEKVWTRLDDEHEIADVRHRGPNWAEERRQLLIRRPIHQEGALFDTVGYEFSALVTSLEIPAAECSNFYDQRGACENTIKEFKNDFGADGFCMNSFHATEAVLRLISVLFNLVTEFKRQVLGQPTVTLGTVRVKLFVLGAMLGRHARKVVLRLGLNRRWKESFATLLDRSIGTAPTAAQLSFSP